MKADHFQTLLDRYFDAALDEADLAELERELLSSREARVAFWRQAHLVEKLRGHGREHHGTTLAAMPSMPRRRRRVVPILAWSAAACVAASLWVALRPANGPSIPHHADQVAEAPAPTAVWAVLEHSASAVWKPEEGPSPGQGLSDQPLELSAGIATLQLISGARVLASGPAVFRPISANRIQLGRGVFELIIPEVASGLEVSCPAAELRCHSGKVRLESPDGRQTEWSVEEGSLMVRQGDAWKVLPAGSRVRTGAGGALLDLPTPEGSAPNLAESVRRRNSTRLTEWREASRRRDSDPALLVHLRFDETGEEATGLAVNSSSHPQASRRASVIASQWVVGRWPGKRGLSFRNAVDRVRIEIRGSHPEATFCAWVRIDELPRYYNALFLSEAGIPGETHWQLSEDGGFRFGVRPRRSGAEGLFDRAFSGPVVSGGQRGVWKHLATTYHAGTGEVVHYVDGRVVARKFIDDPVPLRFGAATIGNCPMPPPDIWGPRSFGGVIDEFMLYSRALDAGEIGELHQEGRPD